MNPDLSLKEKAIHGTKKNPVWALNFTAGEGTPYPDHFFVERHWHSDVEILFIQKGSYLFEINLDNYILTEGDICILNSGELHQITGLETSAVHDAVLFDPRILDFSYTDEWEENFITPFLNQSLICKNILHPYDAGYPEIKNIVRKLVDTSLCKEHSWYIKSKLLILELFHLVSDSGMLLPSEEVMSAADSRKIGRYKTIISYIEKHYSEPITLQQLADTIPCNSQYLCRTFREISGISPIQYLISYRLEQACLHLSQTTRPVTEIALDCGFENISYFIRKFKEAKGCTPKEYRRQTAKGTE